MDAQKQQALERLKTANNILVTVSRDPSVDQLSAAIGITLLLNKLGKHATAVYSGKTPSTIEFLQPEKTLEKNTDSLRDFIIALDKSKADKLRYKVEDQMVKIFITPYRTSISDKDLEFSQGDFNVEVVLALGVARQQDLDQAITSHGRILHDATVIGVATQPGTETIGSINWLDPAASSLSEMMTFLGLALDNNVLDGQMATAFLTGIVAETERFSNQKTTAETMQVSAKLMESGANQQLVASELATPAALGVTVNEESPEKEEGAEPQDAVVNADGSLVIEHQPGEEPAEAKDAEEQPAVDEIKIDYDGQIKTVDDAEAEPEASPDSGTSSIQSGSRLIMQPPSMGGKLTANSEPEGLDPAVDPLSQGHSQQPLLHRTVTPLGAQSADADEAKASEQPAESESAPAPAPSAEASSMEAPAPETPTPEPAEPTNDHSNETLSDLEKLVASPHTTKADSNDEAKASEQPAESEPAPAPAEPTSPPVGESSDSPADLDTARDAVEQAVHNTPSGPVEPVKSLNAMPVDLDLGDIPAVNTSPASAFNDPAANAPTPETPTESSSVPSPHEMHVSSDPDLPVGLITNEPVDMTAAPTNAPSSSPVVPPQGPPPEVPPPMMPPNLGQPSSSGSQNPASPPSS